VGARAADCGRPGHQLPTAAAADGRPVAVADTQQAAAAAAGGHVAHCPWRRGATPAARRVSGASPATHRVGGGRVGVVVVVAAGGGGHAAATPLPVALRARRGGKSAHRR